MTAAAPANPHYNALHPPRRCEVADCGQFALAGMAFCPAHRIDPHLIFAPTAPTPQDNRNGHRPNLPK